MSLTVRFDETDAIRLTNSTVAAQPPDRIEFSVQGSLTATESMLAAFEGATLHPVGVTVSTDSDARSVDLTGPASLRLENVDVGVASPDADSIPDDLDALKSSADEFELPDSRPDVLSFTVEGAIRDVDAPTAALESIAAADAEIEAITFAVDESVRTDGGSEPEIALELSLFGYGVVVRRDGTIVVGSGGRFASIGIDVP